jgi:hypothetical protein
MVLNVNVSVLYIAHYCSTKLVCKELQLCYALNGITQFYLRPTRLIPVWAEQTLDYYICNELLTSKGWVELSVPGFEPRTFIALRE